MTEEIFSTFMLFMHPLIVLIFILTYKSEVKIQGRGAIALSGLLLSIFGGIICFWSILMRDGLALGMEVSTGWEAVGKSAPGVILLQFLIL